MEITKKDQKEFFFVFEFFRVFPCIPWLKNISLDTLSHEAGGLSIIVADLRRPEPLHDGSPPCDGQERAEYQRHKKRV